MKIIRIIIAISIILTSCKQNNYKINISKDATKVSVNRYDLDIMQINTDNISDELTNLSSKYEVFLGKSPADNIQGMQRIKSFVDDTVVKSISEHCTNIFPKNHSFNRLNRALNHVEYYYPDFEMPTIYTYISGFDYEYPVIYNDSLLIIALDMYLGDSYEYYMGLGIPRYMIRRFDKEYIERDCMMEIANSYNTDEAECSRLIDWMIYYGKNIEFTKMMIPNISDTCILGYTAEQLQWCKDNEEMLWRYMISNDLLFTTDIMTIHKFIDDGPFTSIFSKESPASLGRWIGWQIVANYRKNNDISISELMKMSDSQTILNASNYRP